MPMSVVRDVKSAGQGRTCRLDEKLCLSRLSSVVEA